jgi:hypothetical protein
MQDKLSVTLSVKDATKFLKGLTKDPQLRGDDDPSVLVEEQYPSEHHAMLQGKTTGSSSDNILTILQWEKYHTPHLSEEQKTILAEQKNKTTKLFQFTVTSNNPWDEVQFTFWKHKVINMVLSAIPLLALKENTSTDVNKLLFATGDHNNVTVTSGDKINLAGLLICYPLLINSPFEEPFQMDDLLDDLLTERHPHTVSQSNGHYEEYEADETYVKLSTLKKAAIVFEVYLQGCLAHISCVSSGSVSGSQNFRLPRVHSNQGEPKPIPGPVEFSGCSVNETETALCQGRTRLTSSKNTCQGEQRPNDHQVDEYSSPHKDTGG